MSTRESLPATVKTFGDNNQIGIPGAHESNLAYYGWRVVLAACSYVEPIRVKQGDRVLFHILNGSATEIRRLALPSHSFKVVALDGIRCRIQRLCRFSGRGRRISAVVEMNHPGVWILRDLDDDDRHHGMGIVVEYAGQKGKGQWVKPVGSKWNYLRFAKPGAREPATG